MNNNENDPPLASFQKLREGMEKEIPSEYLMKNKSLKETLKEDKGKKIVSQGNLIDFREGILKKFVCSRNIFQIRILIK